MRRKRRKEAFGVWIVSLNWIIGKTAFIAAAVTAVIVAKNIKK